MDDHDDVRSWVRQEIREHADRIRGEFSAHAVGIGTRPGGGPTLRVYVNPGEGAAVPAEYTFAVPGRDEPITVAVDVVEAPPVELE